MVTTDVPGPGASGHEHAAELRALTLLALDRLDPLLVRLRAAASGEAAGGATPCAACPVCRALAAVRSEPAGRLAEHAAGLAAALREVLGEPAAEPGLPAEPGPPAAPVRRVQHIRVDREPATAGGTPC